MTPPLSSAKLAAGREVFFPGCARMRSVPTPRRWLAACVVLGWPGGATAAPIDLGWGDLLVWVFGYFALFLIVFVGAAAGQFKVAGRVVLAALVLTPLGFFAAISSFEHGRSPTSLSATPPTPSPAPATPEQRRAFQAYCGGAPALHPVAADTPRTLLVRVDDKAMYEATGLTGHAVVDAIFGNPAVCESSRLAAVEIETSVPTADGWVRRWQRMDANQCAKSAWRDVPEALARYELAVGDRVERTNLSGVPATAISLRINDRSTGERVAEDTAFTLRSEPMPELCRHGKEQFARMISGVFGP